MIFTLNPYPIESRSNRKEVPDISRRDTGFNHTHACSTEHRHALVHYSWRDFRCLDLG